MRNQLSFVLKIFASVQIQLVLKMANIYEDLLNAFELEGSSDSEDEQDQPDVMMIPIRHVLFVCYMNCMQIITVYLPPNSQQHWWKEDEANKKTYLWNLLVCYIAQTSDIIIIFLIISSS